eukprot:sb/3478498/
MTGQKRNPFDLKSNDQPSSDAMMDIEDKKPGPLEPKKARDYLIAFTRRLENNLDGASFLVGEKLTYADFALFAELRRPPSSPARVLEELPPPQVVVYGTV